tara:strand:+ start:8914 stop:9783 length:870 start_codon:yes stop_codon:yes gene_type:complete
MKILVPNFESPILQDIAQSLESIKGRANIQPLLWNVQHKPIVDVFDEVSPDLVFLHASQLDIAFEIICQEFDFKYILITENLPEKIPKIPNAVITTAQFKNNFPPNLPLVEMKSHAHVAQIHSANYEEGMESDVLVNSSGIKIDQNILQMLSLLTSKYRTKIIGDSKVGLHHYLGSVNIFERGNFIKSSKVVVDLTGYDCWDAAYLKVAPLCGTSPHPSIRNFTDLNSLAFNIDMLLKDEGERSKYVDECYKETWNGNTCYHTAIEIFNKIKEPVIAQHFMDHMEELMV